MRPTDRARAFGRSAPTTTPYGVVPLARRFAAWEGSGRPSVALRQSSPAKRGSPKDGGGQSATEKLSGSVNENACAGGGHRRGRGRRLDALSSGQERLERQRSRRAQGADLRLDLACGGPPAAVQPQLFGRPDPQIFGRPLQDAPGGDRPRRRLPPGVQHPPRAHRATGWTNITITPASPRRSASRSSS